MFRFERQEMMEDSGLMTFQTSSLQEPSLKFRPFLDRLVRFFCLFFVFIYRSPLRRSVNTVLKSVV